MKSLFNVLILTGAVGTTGCCSETGELTSLTPAVHRIVATLDDPRQNDANAVLAYRRLFWIPVVEPSSTWARIASNPALPPMHRTLAYGAFWRRALQPPIGLRDFVVATSIEDWFSKNTVMERGPLQTVPLEEFAEDDCGLFRIDLPGQPGTNVWFAVSRDVSVDDLINAAHGHGGEDLMIVAVDVNIW